MKLRITKSSLVDEGKPVEFGKLLGQLECVLGLLRTAGKKENKRITWQIQTLSKQSPTEMNVTPVNSEAKKQLPMSSIEQQVFKALILVTTGRDLQPVSTDILLSLRDLARNLEQNSSLIEVTLNERSVTVSPSIIKQIDEEIKNKYTEVGTFQGKLDAINVHVRNECSLYIEFGTRKVRCKFNPELLPLVRQNVGEYVEVHGLVTYRVRDFFPHEIFIHKLDALSSGGDIFDNERIPAGEVVDAVQYVRERRG